MIVHSIQTTQVDLLLVGQGSWALQSKHIIANIILYYLADVKTT